MTEASGEQDYEDYGEGDEGEYWEGDQEGEEGAEADQEAEEEGEKEFHDDFDQPLAFQVDGATKQPASEPPADAAEYLRRVQKEASALGSVKRAKGIDPDSFKHKQTRYLPQIELAAPCPEAFRPDPEWEQRFGADFTAIRASLAKLQPAELSKEPLPAVRDAKSWLYFVMGSNATIEQEAEDEPPPSSSSASSSSSSSSSSASASSSSGEAKKGGSSDSSAAALSQSSGHLPSLSLLCRFDQVTVRMLIGLLARTDFTSTFGYHLCVWLFALLAQLDKPIDDDMSFVLRNLYRKLSRTRATQKKEGNIVAYCNMLLTIIHTEFQQSVPSEL